MNCCQVRLLLVGEWIGARRWAAISVGFLGVLVVLRPSGEGMLTVAGAAVLDEDRPDRRHSGEGVGVAHVLVDLHPGPRVVGLAQEAPGDAGALGHVALQVVEGPGQIGLEADPHRIPDVEMGRGHGTVR